MNQSKDSAAIRQQLTELVRSFEPIGPSRFGKLLPIKDLIAELRQKRASYRLIQQILAAAGITVAVDTIGRFCRDEIEQRVARPTRARTRSRNASDRTGQAASSDTRSLSDTESIEPRQSAAPPPSSDKQPVSEAATDRPRSRGPRIADPRNV